MTNGIIWLASYPKSGNTWIRIFLHNYILDQDQPIDINEINQNTISSSRSMFDNLTGISSSNLSFNEIDQLRPDYYREYAKSIFTPSLNGYKFIKVHDALTHLKKGEAIFPLDATRGVIHIVRNPFDVAISMSKFFNTSIETSIKHMKSPDYIISANPNKLLNQFRQKILSWDQHFDSWNQLKTTPYILIRYEDMLSDPHIVFSKIIEFLGLPLNEERLSKAINFSSFDRLKQQEKEKGFLEKPSFTNTSFFRSGKIGEWRQKLSIDQIVEITFIFAETIKKLSYIDHLGNLKI